MFFGLLAMVLVTLCTFAETQAGGSDFNDIGASEYNAFAGNDAEAGIAKYNSGIAYTTDDAPVNSHDL